MNILVRFKKPKVIWAFCILAGLSTTANASFYSAHVAPVGQRAFDSTSQKILAAGLGSVWLAQSQDSSARHQYQNHQTMSEQTADVGDRFDQYAVGPIIAVAQLYLDPENGVSHARALVSTALVTQTLKHSLQRQRPDGSNHLSMPSGHTSTAFATATALTYSYGWKAGIWAYPLATFVGMSRMADDVHWLSDTVAGAFVGMWMGRASSYSVAEAAGDSVSVQWIPVLQSRYQGLAIRMEF